MREAEDAKNQRYEKSMVISKQTIEEKLNFLRSQEDVSDMWSDSDTSDYRKEQIETDFDNKIMTRLNQNP